MIIICPNEIKMDYLKNSKLHNYKFFTLDEIKSKVFLKPSSDILYRVSSKYKVKPSIASKIIDSLYYINTTNKLFPLKTYLIENKYLIKDDYFLKSLKEEILFDGYPRTKEIDIIIDLLSKYTKVSYKELASKYDLKEIYEFLNSEEEIRFVAERVLDLVNRGTDINKIVVVNSNNTYIPVINKVFNLFKIPFDLNYQKPLTSFKETKEFLKEIKNSTLKIDELGEVVDRIKDDGIRVLITNILNKYYNVKEEVRNLYDVIYFELKHTFIKNDIYLNVVNIYSTLKLFDDSYYVFYINGCRETKYKDNDYLSDVEKIKLGLNPSYELNEIDDLYKLKVLSNIKNLFISYKKTHNGDYYVIDDIFEDLEIKKYEFLNNSSAYNKYLFDHTNEYDNTYKKIEYNSLKEYLNNKLNLSYSSIDVFFKCKFRFYLNNILKIEPTVPTIAISVGKMFHEILEQVLKNDFNNYLSIIDEVSAKYLNGDQKEKFYKEKLKKEAIKKVEYLKEVSTKTDFKNTFFEKYLEIKLTDELDIKLVGFIDKVLTYENYVIVVDYKTGDTKVDLKKLNDGFSMQLPIYLYLITKNGNYKIAGAYLDHILDEIKTSVYGKRYDEIVDNRLEGITTSDKSVLKHIDKFYDVNSFIKGIKVKNDGDFYAFSKVYSDEEFNDMLTLVDTKIKEVIASIKDADFKINPKKYYGESEIAGCSFCPFKEVCYMSYKDVEMIGGVSDELDA